MDTDATLRARTDESSLKVGSFSIDILVQGFRQDGVPWRARLEHGRAGALPRQGDPARRRHFRHAARHCGRLEAHGLKAADVTDVILTHAHYITRSTADVFRFARSDRQTGLEWPWRSRSATTPPGILRARASRLAAAHGVEIAEEVIPGLTAYAGPGHTPDSCLRAQRGRARRDLLRRRREEPRRNASREAT